MYDSPSSLIVAPSEAGADLDDSPLWVEVAPSEGGGIMLESAIMERSQIWLIGSSSVVYLVTDDNCEAGLAVI